MKLKAVFILSFITVISLSCGTNFKYNINKKRLITNTWRINTYVDYDQNNTVDIRQADYLFLEDGTLIKIYENNDSVNSIWSISNDGDYLTMGSNTFKITELTNRVMSLRYGEVEMFFTSYNSNN